MIPDQIKSEIERSFDNQIIDIKPQSGGDISHAAILTFENQDALFLKWNSSAPEKMFKAEAKGLKLLNEADIDLAIPDPFLVGDDFLLMEVIEQGSSDSKSTFEFGVQLAKLHKTTADQFGLDHDNFIGRLPQSNKKHSGWTDFFVSKRIETQLKMGFDSGKFSAPDAKNLSAFTKNVEQIFPQELPALLHGDLWSGNYMFTTDGKASIYDPAVYFGHREMDIAMTRLFGGFAPEFYEGYNSEYPLTDGFEGRIELCNLYPILVHANLFGGGYIRRALGILKRFS